MSDLEDIPAETPLSPEEAVIRRHRREKKELQGTILSMKKAVAKSDKKKKKDTIDEIARLESELAVRHKNELDAFRKMIDPICELTAAVVPVILEDDVITNAADDTPTPGTPKMSKARKRREKKLMEDRERQKRIEVETMELEEKSDRHKENILLKEILAGMNLAVYEITPDGHCLYAAVSHQLNYHKCKSEEIGALRCITSSYLLEHKEDFVNYFDDESIRTSEEEFKGYCQRIKETSCWGGEIEIQVISKALERQIRVIQAEGPILVFGENYNGPSLDLVYHRHLLQLGAHYNSAISLADVVEVDSGIAD